MLLLSCQSRKSDHQTWQVYKGGPDANNYSALDQINRSNVKDLEVAWTFYPDDEPTDFQFWKYECNPIVVDTLMFITSAWRQLYAINAATGEKIWSFDPLQGRRGGGVLRGVTYWKGDGGTERIFVNARSRLFSVDARSGKLDTSFGEQGTISLNIDGGPNRSSIARLSTPGIIYQDLLIIGAAVSESAGAPPGDVRAFHVRTGALAWTFHTIPHPGEKGYDTWPKDAYQYAGAANAWAGLSLDMERGIVYVPTGSPGYDYYAADRTGANLFGNCIIALDAATGEYIWHYQTVHHDIWDYDLPTAPNLVTIKKDGQEIDAIAQPSKIGFIYVLDRETGTPIFPIEERPVPESRVPGEESWPTQPFPTLPKPFIRQAITEGDLIKFSDEAFRENKQRLDALRFEGLFTPPDTAGTLFFPGSRGGAEWGGGGYDMESGILYINVNESPEIATMDKVKVTDHKPGETKYAVGQRFYNTYCLACHGVDKSGIEANPSLVDITDRLSPAEIMDQVNNGAGIMPSFVSVVKGYEEELMAFLAESGKDELSSAKSMPEDTSTTYLNVTAHGYFLDGLDRPIVTPPWGTLSAIDLHTGDYVWKVPLGNDTELQQPGAPPTGIENYGGPAVTAGGLVFIGATLDKTFRAFDSATGEVLWTTELPGHALANPAVYQLDGKQYVSIAVSIGADLRPTKCAVLTFALP
ncbi:MAG: PQQ-binding-like beta-propeller repeat protein [Saprospiraceae bacterium]|nr:PQQ-binding-like beta-propeller repeat protein [Saprospiraceae bacterium]